MEKAYSSDKNIHILISLLKQNGIKKVVVSPGTAHVLLVASMQFDGEFEMYSAVDERGAAYLACGLAMESGEAVVLSCTGATASRNYFPGLTEAFYRKLPILAVTAASDVYPDNLASQYIDRSEQPKDTVKYSVRLPIINSENDEEISNLKINNALWQLRKNGGGPVHIDLPTDWRGKLTEKSLKAARYIKGYSYDDELPAIKGDRIAIIVGAHSRWNKRLIKSVETFCEKYNAVVLVEHSSGYKGKYHIKPTILASQELFESKCFNIDTLIHIGTTIGDVYTNRKMCNAKEVWRVNCDGVIRDPFKKLKYVFEMSEEFFFEYYTSEETLNRTTSEMSYYTCFAKEAKEIEDSIPEIPFSSIWIASKTADKIPPFANVHLGIGNVMRAFNLFEFQEDVCVTANTGAWGIDGALSTSLGIALANTQVLTFVMLGDLAFFYDLNTLGNRHVGKNLRIMVINNGKGVEMRIHESGVQRNLGDLADEYSAAGGHFGNQSRELVKHFAEDLGFLYISADSKESYESKLIEFVNPNEDKPIVFEIFTNDKDEREAWHKVRNIYTETKRVAKQKLIEVLGDKGVNAVIKVRDSVGKLLN